MEASECELDAPSICSKWLLQRVSLPGHRAQVSVTHSSHSYTEHYISLRASVEAWRGCTSGAQHKRQPHAPSCREDPIESARWGAERSITAHTSSAVGRRLASSCLQALMMASTSSGHSSGTLHPKTSVLFVLKSISVRQRLHRTWGTDCKPPLRRQRCEPRARPAQMLICSSRRAQGAQVRSLRALAGIPVS